MLIALTDDPEIYHGAAVGLQVVGRRLQEERVLGLSEVIGKAIAQSSL
jgi:amidase